jgi:L-lactate dehydrogenase (FMN-dependent) and related alpha-hydroxy acid dehydrogenases
MKKTMETARARIKKCRVCPECNGKACAGEIPGMGGIGSGAGFMNNVTSLAAVKVLPRYLHSADTPDASRTLWGKKLSLPLMTAPVGSIAQLDTDMSTERYVEIMAQACHESGVIATFGDTGILADLETKFHHAENTGASLGVFYKPVDVAAIEKRMDITARAGCTLCGVDVDAAGFMPLRKLDSPVGVRTPKEIAAMARLAHERGMKFIVKGIMAVDEARLAVDAGVDGVLVSNHGGRSIDCTPGVAEVLPAIAEAVGKDTVILADGGIRTGLDILRMIALGAQAVLICRPVIVAMHEDEEKGLQQYVAGLISQLQDAMRLTGCQTIDDISSRVLYGGCKG